MPPKVSYMGVKVWPADKGEKKKRWDPSSFSLLVVLPNPHLFLQQLIRRRARLFFLPLIRRALGDDPNYHLVYTVNMHNLLYKA